MMLDLTPTRKQMALVTTDYAVSIIIPVCNQLDYTRRCLGSVLRFTPQPYEVIVIDNGSTDGTAEYLAGFPNIRLVTNPANRGYAAACNQGLKLAMGANILLLNNDTEVTPGWLDRLLTVFEQHPEAGLVGPMSNYASGWQSIETIEPAVLTAKFAGRSIETNRLIGFCLLARREVFERIGELDEQFGPGNFDDDDLCLRAALAGFKTRIALDAFVYHKGHATFRGEGFDLPSLIKDNWQLFKTKWQLPADLPYGESYWTYVVKPTIGVAMLARNNAADIAPALEPFLGKVDDIAIMLGGWSTDNTADVAAHYGRVGFYTGPLTDEGGLADFGQARQQNFDMLNTDWVLLVESDDRWQGVENLEQVLRDAADYEGVLFPQDLGHGTRFLQSRLFRRSNGYWTSPVHEDWKYYSAPYTRTLTVNAMTVRQETRGKNKMASVLRNIAISEAYLEKHGFNYRLLIHLPHEYLVTKQYHKAIKAIEAILERREDLRDELNPVKLFQLYYSLCLAYLCLEDYPAALVAITTGLGHACNLGHGWAMLAEVANMMEIYDLAIFAADRALLLGKPVSAVATPEGNVTYLPLFIKAKALEQQGRKHEAIAAANLGLAMKQEPEIINLKNRLCEELGVIP